ncbi:MAG: bifunctional 2-polyprenyl-6-hydroxyphenol methylase/3-demethylubiquinol 3-O-methyltransferase UbiG [bacterium]|nr:bifunctional 2-polyprenyl-6-hydroxyphenol methylase/3-demethylubiquinol 3-O-methyltransferase UbiG [bacterium]
MTQAQAHNAPDNTLDPEEIKLFSRIADEWWDPLGKFRPLHQLNPIRLTYIRDKICHHFQIEKRTAAPLKGLKVLDIGCGGGLLCEPMTRMGADVTGVDPAERSIKAARAHADDMGLKVDYRISRAEELVGAGELFDVVVNMEVIEHVPDMPAFLNICTDLVRPGGLMLASTLNRTVKSYGLAIIGAEYILRWLPAGTHQWERFVTPDELKKAMLDASLVDIEQTGMSYHPLTGNWTLGSDLDVNYLASAKKPS